MKLKFVWWNTSLSPRGKSRASDEEKSLAYSMIRGLLHEHDADLIALGEVNSDDIDAIRNNCNLKGYEIFNGHKKAGRSFFETCVIFKSEKLALADDRNITAKKGENTFRVAQRLDLIVFGEDIPLHLFVSHWPSRLHMQPNHPDRTFIAHNLRTSIEDLMDVYKKETTIVLLGDYNDEPFDDSLSQHLMATRDRTLVMKQSHLLYNPFWRKLGHSDPHVYKTGESAGVAGTCFHKSGRESKWKTFDQIIFSSNFLSNSKWFLNEKLTQILDVADYTELVMCPKQIFDHFPVVSVVEKVA